MPTHSLPFWTSRRLGSAPVRLACTHQSPNVVLYLRAQGEGAFLHIASWRYKSNGPPAKGNRGPSTVSKINGDPKGSHVK